MISILTCGKEKKYYAKCGKCATEIEYEHNDVKYERVTGMSGEIRTVTCPVCGETISVNLLTKEECEKTRGGLFNSCCCG